MNIQQAFELLQEFCPDTKYEIVDDFLKTKEIYPDEGYQGIRATVEGNWIEVGTGERQLAKIETVKKTYDNESEAARGYFLRRLKIRWISEYRDSFYSMKGLSITDSTTELVDNFLNELSIPDKYFSFRKEMKLRSFQLYFVNNELKYEYITSIGESKDFYKNIPKTFKVYNWEKPAEFFQAVYFLYLYDKLMPEWLIAETTDEEIMRYL